jgi:anthranilate phosphoribosyltransferase
MPDPHDILHSCLKRILEQRETLSRDTARDLLGSILDRAQNQTLPDDQIRIAALLGALAARGETIDELAGFVDALRARVIAIPLTGPERSQLVDSCGTGGDLSGTFNISTAAGLVAAAAGARVAKHGNRAVTSSCGSADVLEALGIPVGLNPPEATAALRSHGFAFLAAPSLQPAMKSIMPIRRAIGVRTAFNILGPMTNPAGAQAQVIGVYAEKLVPIVAETLARLNTRHAFVVHGFDAETGAGMDEISISGSTRIGEVRFGEVKFSTVTPADFGLPIAPVSALAGGDAQANAAILRVIFSGEPGPRRDVVVINAAAVLITAGLAANFLDGVRLAQDTIDAGKVSRLIEALGWVPHPREARVGSFGGERVPETTISSPFLKNHPKG